MESFDRSASHAAKSFGVLPDSFLSLDLGKISHSDFGFGVSNSGFEIRILILDLGFGLLFCFIF